MKKIKVISLLLSLFLILGVAMPWTVASSLDVPETDSASTPGSIKAAEQASEAASEAVEAPTTWETTAEETPAETAPEETSPAVSESDDAAAPDSTKAAEQTPEAASETAEETSAEEDTTADAPEETSPAVSETDSAAETDSTKAAEQDSEAAGEAAAKEDAAAANTAGAASTEAAPVHDNRLFAQLMACETLKEMKSIVEAAPEGELSALTAEQIAEVETKTKSLEAPPAPEVVPEAGTDAPVISEIIFPTVNFSNVAPVGAPVEG